MEARQTAAAPTWPTRRAARPMPLRRRSGRAWEVGIDNATRGSEDKRNRVGAFRSTYTASSKGPEVGFPRDLLNVFPSSLSMHWLPA